MIPDIEHDSPIWWIKKGGGSFRTEINGRAKIVKPGEKFRARPSEIPVSFRDTVVPTDGKVVPEPTAVEVIPEGKKPIYQMVPSSKRVMKPRGNSRSLFDVFDQAGNKVNEDKPMLKAEAETLIGYDIINPDGKVMNELALTKEKAEKVLLSLNS